MKLVGKPDRSYPKRAISRRRRDAAPGRRRSDGLGEYGFLGDVDKFKSNKADDFQTY